MTKITASEAKSLVQRYIENRMDFTQISARLWLDFCNVVDEAFWWQDRMINPEKYIEEQDLAVTGSTREFTVTTLNTIAPEECGVFFLDGEGNYTDQKLDTTRKGSSKTGIFLKKDSNGDLKTIEFTPTTIAAKTYGLRYIPDRTRLTNIDLSEDLLIDIQHTDYILQMFLRVLHVWNRDQTLISIHDQELQDATRNLLQNISPDPPNGWEGDDDNF